MKLEGSKILLTGASSGIGAALAPILAERGATVGIAARRKERLEEVVELCRKHTPESRYWAVDLSDLDAAEKLALDAWDAFGGYDAVIHNAAIPKRVHISRLTMADMHETMKINFDSPVRMTLAVLPKMLERKSGTIMWVSSMGGRIPIANESAYNAAKYAMNGFVEAMYLDLTGSGVNVKLVMPGPIDTEIWDIPGNEPALMDIDKVSPAECAAGIADGLADDGFEYYCPPIYPGGIGAKDLALAKVQDCDGYLAGMGEMARQMRDAL
jgi:short-subunit dehydrogenase